MVVGAPDVGANVLPRCGGELYEEAVQTFLQLRGDVVKLGPGDDLFHPVPQGHRLHPVAVKLSRFALQTERQVIPSQNTILQSALNSTMVFII